MSLILLNRYMSIKIIDFIRSFVKDLFVFSGAFFIPYLTCALLGGVPMFFLEVGIGQFMSEGGISVWKMCPLFTGMNANQMMK